MSSSDADAAHRVRVRPSRRRVLAGAVAATLALPARMAVAADPIPVRMMALGVGFPFLMTSAWKEQGFDQKYGFSLQVEAIGNLSGQWNALRSGSFDLVMGNFLDVMRQHKEGLKARAFQFCYNYSDPIVTDAAKPYKKLGDLKGASVGVTKVTFLPVLLYRVGGKKAYGFDLVTDAKISEASPSLLPEMLRAGKLDATYSLHSLVFTDLVENRMREVANILQVLADAGWEVAMTLFVLSDEWRAKHGEAAVRRLAHALRDLNETLRTKDAGWDAYAATAKVDVAHKEAFKTTFRKLLIPNFGPKNLAPMQEIVDAMTAAAGEPIIGVQKVDPAAFDFESMA
jgi:ABC-type nitrate/sulfonate/bicarbonate transport system substrate-binding protein